MKISFDLNKSDKNTHERGLPFENVIDFDWESAIYYEDNRYIYPEKRFVAIGYLEERLHVICFTPIQDGARIISFRKANSREIKRYEKETAHR